MEPFDTLVVHGAVESDPLHHAVNVPIYQTSTYELEDVAQFPEFAYSRVSNPTQKAVEAQIAAMEHGHAGFAFASGMTPYLQRPLDFGFDIVVQSATKYLG
ncbi:MAG: PLP-dependent transferase, partial [Oscillospiraceae bacterium]|nr:PLP-dependent transferase [Oscillospiraceae bacterium]